MIFVILGCVKRLWRDYFSVSPEESRKEKGMLHNEPQPLPAFFFKLELTPYYKSSHLTDTGA